MEDRKNTIKKLMSELRVKTYMHDVLIDCEPESNLFLLNLVSDWRFQLLYENYIRKNGDITRKEFAKKLTKTDIFWNLFNQLLFMPDKLKPKQVYVDECYPFLFEMLNSISTPSLEEFTIETYAEFNSSIKKIFMDLSDEETDNRIIEYLKKKIKERDDIIKKRRDSYPRTKRIYKYNIDDSLDKIYNSRKECCESDNITKAALSMHLSGKRKTLNGYIYKEIEC